MTRSIYFAHPGDLNLKTGGYGYDRKMIAGLRGLGWEVELLGLGEGFPDPSEAVRLEAERVLSEVPDGARLMIDGLAYGVLQGWAAREAVRLKIVALVHHPLALETGLEMVREAHLHASERQALSFARHVIVTSQRTAKELVANFGLLESGLTVALPGTEPGPVSACDGDPPHILSIGTLIPRKAHHVLIDALKEIEHLAWTATVVGNKQLHPQTTEALERQLQALALNDRVVLAGECKSTRALLATADIFALASRYEGYGMVFAEALSQGVPVVACRAGAIPDVVPSDAGILVPVDDRQALAEALQTLVSDKAFRRRLALGARRAGDALPCWDLTARMISQALEVLE